jgi:methyl-accepting chemotaxis protein
VNQASRFGLAQRLYTISGVLIAAMLVLAICVWYFMNRIGDHADDINANRVPQMMRIAELELNVTRVSLQLRHAILSRTPEEMSATLDDVGEKKRLLDTKLDEFGKSMTTDAGRQAFAPLPALAQEFWAIGGENIRLIKEGKKAEAFAYLVDKTIPARNRLLAPLASEKKRQGEALAKDVGAVSHEADFALAAVLGAVALVACGLLGFAVYVVRVMRQLGAEPGELKQVAEAVAAGDLTVPIELRAGDTSSVMAALQKMTNNLARTVQSVRSNADSVSTASAQIASGNMDLSNRTEQQASSLEETAASMEELSSTVKQNSDNAKQANQLAMGASTVAIKGGEVVGQVVDTMKGINDSSKKIADIISVIDGIAFQTNILALNAAVEAARAGEQGRGFAVVASEVRSLAQRSAEAAKEIKTLIGASVERVAQGTALVDQAGVTMSEIVTAIKRVTDIMGEISSASVEQSAGVSQIGEAITQMDQATQQNAALVEQSAAAAESLKGQAKQLVQAVAVFKLSQGEQHYGEAPVLEAQTAPHHTAQAQRRGPNRAKNVSRLGARPAAAQKPAKQPEYATEAPRKTGTDDEWTSF